MKATRQRLIEYLDEKKIACAHELGRSLNLTPANIRHHLSILEKEGVVEVFASRQENRRGRPALFFRLTKQVTSHNLDNLASTLLELTINKLSPDDRILHLKMIAQHLVGDVIIELNPTKRLYTAIQNLNKMKYYAHWEARREGPRIIFSHCPYAAILPEHPELCQIDIYLLEAMVTGKIIPIARLEASTQNLPQCIFSVR